MYLLFFKNYLVNRSRLCKGPQNNLGSKALQFSSVIITNPEGFAEDENIYHMVERVMHVTNASSKSIMQAPEESVKIV